jgi:hypothetical protein
MSRYSLPKSLHEFPAPPRKPFNLGHFFKPQPILELPRPTGEMAEYLGTAYNWKTICTGQENDVDDQLEQVELAKDEIAKIQHYAQAYPIPVLIGQTFSIHHESEIEGRLNELFQRQLPTIDWEKFQVPILAFQKYLILHFQVPAPPDLNTNQAMGLEIYIEPYQINGFLPHSEEFRQLRRNQMYAATASSYCSEIQGDFEMMVMQATYSNLTYPNIGIPFYF